MPFVTSASALKRNCGEHGPRAPLPRSILPRSGPFRGRFGICLGDRGRAGLLQAGSAEAVSRYWNQLRMLREQGTELDRSHETYLAAEPLATSVFTSDQNAAHSLRSASDNAAIAESSRTPARWG